MRQFAARFPDITIVPQAVAQLPWGHISLLIHKIKDETVLAWYADQTIEQGWSRLALERQVKDNLYQRQAIDIVKSSNFLTRLPSPQSRLAHELLKQPYNFDFLGLHDDAHEREIEHASIEHYRIDIPYVISQIMKMYCRGCEITNDAKRVSLGNSTRQCIRYSYHFSSI